VIFPFGMIFLLVMAVGAGKEAPDFKVRDIYGEEIELKSFKGKKNILLFFSRYIGCSWCQMFVIDIMRNEEKLKSLDTEVIVITESEEEVLKRFAPPKEKCFLRMVSDPEKKLYKLYGVDIKGKIFTGKVITESIRFLKYIKDYRWIKGGLKGDSRQAPACFVIGKDGVIKFSFLGEGIADHPSIDEIIKLLELMEK